MQRVRGIGLELSQAWLAGGVYVGGLGIQMWGHEKRGSEAGASWGQHCERPASL